MNKRGTNRTHETENTIDWKSGVYTNMKMNSDTKKINRREQRRMSAVGESSQCEMLQMHLRCGNVFCILNNGKFTFRQIYFCEFIDDRSMSLPCTCSAPGELSALHAKLWSMHDQYLIWLLSIRFKWDRAREQQRRPSIDFIYIK